MILGIYCRSDLEAVLTVMLDDISSQRNSEPGYSPHEGIIENFLNVATFSKIDEGCAESCMSFEDFRSWCSLLPSVMKYLGSLLMPSDSGLLPIFIHFLSLISVLFFFLFFDFDSPSLLNYNHNYFRITCNWINECMVLCGN